MAELQNKTLMQLKGLRISKQAKLKNARGEGYRKTLQNELATINRLIAQKEGVKQSKQFPAQEAPSAKDLLKAVNQGRRLYF